MSHVPCSYCAANLGHPRHDTSPGDVDAALKALLRSATPQQKAQLVAVLAAGPVADDAPDVAGTIEMPAPGKFDAAGRAREIMAGMGYAPDAHFDGAAAGDLAKLIATENRLQGFDDPHVADVLAAQARHHAATQARHDAAGDAELARLIATEARLGGIR